MESRSGSGALPVALAILAALTGCGGEPVKRHTASGTATTVAPAPRLRSDTQVVDRVKRLAYAEMQALSARTCAAVPRTVLADSLSAISRDPAPAMGYDDNGIALLFVEDVGMRGIPLQRAAYDGCLSGLESQRGSRAGVR